MSPGTRSIEQQIRALPAADRKALAHYLFEFAIQSVPRGPAMVLGRVANCAMGGLWPNRTPNPGG